jgi:hypothetical protein
MNDFTPDRAPIFRVTRVTNLPRILEHGLVCIALEHVAGLEAEVLQPGLAIELV